jgi:glycolate oxidase subunit GlcD
MDFNPLRALRSPPWADFVLRARGFIPGLYGDAGVLYLFLANVGKHKKKMNILEKLQNIVDPGKLLTDEDSLQTYGKDWTKLYQPKPTAIVFPKSTEQVQQLVKLANEEKLALVPSGGRTGLSAGAVAANGEVVVAFDYMNKILSFSAHDRTAICQSGVVTKQLQLFAQEKGLFYPVDFASAGSSQIGGNISTNAGGIKVIKYGMTRDWVAGLTVVTGRGEVLRLNKDLTKNATGYDLRHLFIGAEGTLGFVTEATMKLTRQPKDLTVLVLGVQEMTDVMRVLQTFQEKIDLTAFEFFSEKAMGHVLAKGDVSRPFAQKCPFYALLEFEAISEQVMSDAMSLFESCVEQGWVTDGVMSQSSVQAKNLWRLREEISESISKHTPYKNDISVTVSRVPDFLRDVDAIVSKHYPSFEIIWFGHIGDGNVHLNILKPADMPKEQFFAECHKVNQWVFEAVQKHNGSISAEHGIGMMKRDYLWYTRSAEEIAYLKAIKSAFDPNNVMNPGKLL